MANGNHAPNDDVRACIAPATVAMQAVFNSLHKLKRPAGFSPAGR
jgi:hypothetical protein